MNAEIKPWWASRIDEEFARRRALEAEIRWRRLVMGWSDYAHAIAEMIPRKWKPAQ